MTHPYLVKSVENKKWLWFQQANTYLQLEDAAFLVFEKLQQNKDIQQVSEWCVDTFQIDAKDARESVEVIDRITRTELLKKRETKNFLKRDKKDFPASFYRVASYCFNNTHFVFYYGNAQIETMFHPLFAHIQCSTETANALHLHLFERDKQFHLFVNEQHIGSWALNEDHVFKGQVFMALLNNAHHKEEQDWMGVLHASAIGNDDGCVLFLGDSGNGKSTASAIAMAKGFSLLADDFVPIDTNGRVLAFPAAISVKKKAIGMLASDFPDLLNAKEYELKAMNKTVRYLVPKALQQLTRKVKALVFIKYQPDGEDVNLQPMNRHEAFQHVVIDAWISPHEVNARFFLDWMSGIPLYKLSYSNNRKMLESISEILDKD